MTIFYIEEEACKERYCVVIDDTYDVANLEAFEREMNELHDNWSYDINEMIELCSDLNKDKSCQED